MSFSCTTFKRIKILLSVLFIIVTSVNCEHCDDEDYTRDAQEKAVLKNSHAADTLAVIRD